MKNIREFRNKLNSLLEERKFLSRQIKGENLSFKKIGQELQNTQEAQQIIQRLSQSVQQEAHNQISSIVTKCLQTVFPEPYQFRLDFRKKRGKTEAVPVFSKNGLDLENPIRTIGGSVVEVAALALRVACLVLSIPKKGLVLILDEPFRMIDRTCKENLKTLIKKLSSELKIQIIYITHDPEFEIGKVIRL